VTARVTLGPFKPDDVEVQLYHGVLDSLGDIGAPKTATAATDRRPGRVERQRTYLFRGTIPAGRSGQYGFSVRVLPKHPALNHVFEPGLVTWGETNRRAGSVSDRRVFLPSLALPARHPINSILPVVPTAPVLPLKPTVPIGR